jgi:hypothetical protein
MPQGLPSPVSKPGFSKGMVLQDTVVVGAVIVNVYVGQQRRLDLSHEMITSVGAVAVPLTTKVVIVLVLAVSVVVVRNDAGGETAMEEVSVVVESTMTELEAGIISVA